MLEQSLASTPLPELGYLKALSSPPQGLMCACCSWGPFFHQRPWHDYRLTLFLLALFWLAAGVNASTTGCGFLWLLVLSISTPGLMTW